MGLFYAYLRDDQLSTEHCRYLLTFANREAADEWWRFVSTPPNPYASNIKRISPQFYFQTDKSNNVASFFSDTRLPNASKFREKLFITTLFDIHGNLPTVRPIIITDHISGGWYFLRSKTDPWSHWYLRIKGECLVCGDADCDAVHVSSEYRTKFRVGLRSPVSNQAPEGFVMIGQDEIFIVGPKDHVLHINEEDLVATKIYQGGTDILFSDFSDRFVTRAEKRINGEISEYVESVEKGSGEAWELVV